MKRSIVLTIDCEDADCNGCKLYGGDGCALGWDHDEWWKQRGPACLAAEARFRALVEAGTVAAGFSPRQAWDAWDRAVKEAGE